MLKAINTKILLAILAALTAIGGLLIHQNHVSEQQATDAAKARTILEQQQKTTDDQKKHDAEFLKQVQENKKKSKAFNRGGSSTNGYIP